MLYIRGTLTVWTNARIDRQTDNKGSDVFFFICRFEIIILCNNVNLVITPCQIRKKDIV